MRVHEFPIIGYPELSDSTLLPTQRQDSSIAPAAKQFSLLSLALWVQDFILANLSFRTQSLTVVFGTSPVLSMNDGDVLTHLRVKSPSVATVKIGTTVGGSQIIEDEVLPANQFYSIARNYAANGSESLYLTGFPTGTLVKAYYST